MKVYIVTTMNVNARDVEEQLSGVVLGVYDSYSKAHDAIDKVSVDDEESGTVWKWDDNMKTETKYFEQGMMIVQRELE